MNSPPSCSTKQRDDISVEGNSGRTMESEVPATGPEMSNSPISSMRSSVVQLNLRGSPSPTGIAVLPRWSKKRRSIHFKPPGDSDMEVKKSASEFGSNDPIKNSLLQESITGLKDSEKKEFTEKEKEAMIKTFDKDYFESYEKVDIHFNMIRDKVRTDAYRDAIEAHRSFFEGKSVIDVGCGTGILSLFAAQCGAREVYAIERSRFAEHTKKIVNKSNWFHRVRVLHGSVEEVELPFWRKQVDAIISEWMGYSLLYESMVESVLYARDKWLAPEGLMFPEMCGLYLFGNEDLEFYDWKYDNYNNKLGDIDVSYFKKVSMGIPVIKRCYASRVVTDSVPLVEFNLYTMKKEDVNFEAEFTLTANRQDYISALSTYFIVKFPTTPESNCMISTHPGLPITHWKQTSFFLNGYIPIFKDEVITGTFKVMQNSKNKRRIDFIIKVDYEGKGGSFHQQNEYSLI